MLGRRDFIKGALTAGAATVALPHVLRADTTPHELTPKYLDSVTEVLRITNINPEVMAWSERQTLFLDGSTPPSLLDIFCHKGTGPEGQPPFYLWEPCLFSELVDGEIILLNCPEQLISPCFSKYGETMFYSLIRFPSEASWRDPRDHPEAFYVPWLRDLRFMGNMQDYRYWGMYTTQGLDTPMHLSAMS